MKETKVSTMAFSIVDDNETLLKEVRAQLDAMSDRPGCDYVVVAEAPQFHRVFLYAMRSDESNALEGMADIAIRHTEEQRLPRAKWSAVKFERFKKDMKSHAGSVPQLYQLAEL